MEKKMSFDEMREKSGMTKPLTAVLTVEQLAEVMYEGTQHVQGLAEKLAKQHGNDIKALTWFNMMPLYVQNFWKQIAARIIEHSKAYSEKGFDEKEIERIENPVVDAMQVLKKALKEDEGYRKTWIDNIAISVYEEITSIGDVSTKDAATEAANVGAERFINYLILQS